MLVSAVFILAIGGIAGHQPDSQPEDPTRYNGYTFDTVLERLACGDRFTTLKFTGESSNDAYVANLSVDEMRDWYIDAIDEGYVRTEMDLLTIRAHSNPKYTRYMHSLEYEQCRSVLNQTIAPHLITNATE